MYDPSGTLTCLGRSYVEIYCEKIQDLLSPGKENLKIVELVGQGVCIQDVTQSEHRTTSSLYPA